MQIALYLLILITGPSHAVAVVAPERIVGVWQMCYALGLPEVSEVDQGYLLFEPTGRYVKVMAGIGAPDTTEVGTYERTAEGVVLTPQKRFQPNGERGGGHVFKPSTLRLLGTHRVILWPAKDLVRELEVLSGHDSLNYSWAKVL
jgi:hypothetical protein